MPLQHPAIGFEMGYCNYVIKSLILKAILPATSKLQLQADLVGDVDAVSSSCEHHGSIDLPNSVGSVTAGVTRAEGSKCQRCWNYSTKVGQDAEHPSLCERCSPVIRDMGFELPKSQPAVAA